MESKHKDANPKTEEKQRRTVKPVHGGVLHPFEPGQSGNPNGRPKKLPALDDAIADVLGDQKADKTALTVILEVVRAKAVKGDLKAIEMLLNYAYGRPVQRNEHTGPDGGSIPVEAKTWIITVK
jgi:hypothetical protein